MATIAISGSASGIGAETRRRLEREGHRIIGIDLHEAEVEADLSTAQGRRSAIERTRQACEGVLDGLVACAGLGPQVSDGALIASVNYFGAQELLAGLRGALEAGDRPAAVAISSNSSRIPGLANNDLTTACLEGDETSARELAADMDGAVIYGSTKLALARWVRRNAPSAEWAGAGIRLNAIAPGATMTPLLEEGLDDPAHGKNIRSFPIPLGDFGKPEQIASGVAFLLGPEASFCCGTILYIDGGSDALIRPDEY